MGGVEGAEVHLAIDAADGALMGMLPDGPAILVGDGWRGERAYPQPHVVKAPADEAVVAVLVGVDYGLASVLPQQFHERAQVGDDFLGGELGWIAPFLHVDGERKIGRVALDGAEQVDALAPSLHVEAEEMIGACRETGVGGGTDVLLEHGVAPCGAFRCLDIDEIDAVGGDFAEIDMPVVG